MRKLKRWTAALLCAVLLLGLLPTAALAVDGGWAQSAVDTLNGIYQTSVFATDDTAPMTVGDARMVLTAMGSSADSLTGDEGDGLTRAMACEVLADAFSLSIPAGQSAIAYLYERNIINGVGDGNLNETGSVTMAQFAVLTYRILNHTGGGMGSSIAGLKPGTDQFYAWLYLAVRKCVPFSVVNTPIGTETIETYTGSSLKPNQPSDRVVYEVSTAPQTGEAIWDAWEAALGDTNIGGRSGFVATDYDPQDTVLEAATKMVKQFAAAKYQGDIQVFHDVTPDNWYYDGILYLTDRQYVIGYGDGQFGANDLAPRYEFAVLLTNVEGVTLPTEPGPGRIIEAIQYVVGKGYMTGSGQEETENWDPFADAYWTTTVTREEATVGILKMIQATEGIDTTSDNLAILNRFTDRGQIASEASKPYLAYAVSMGLLNGTSSTTLSPNEETTRAQIGVLLYRTLIGVDATKMKDYADNTAYAIRPDTTLVYAVQPDTVLMQTYLAPLADTQTTLTLREDWRLTSDLDLAVPEGTTLTIDGQGKYHIYEMGGTLQNSGLGKVVFAKDTETTNGTILYPLGSSGVCDPASSDALMEQRQPHKVTVNPSTNGTVTVDKPVAKAGETVTLTIIPNNGYELASLSVTKTDGTQIEVSNNTFVMPAADVTVSAAFRTVSGGGPIGGGSGGTSGVNGSGDNVSISPSGGSVTSSQMTSAVNKADAGAAITVKSTASSVTLPVGGMADAAENDNDVVVDLQSGQVILSAQAIAGMTDGASASGKVEVAITTQTSSQDEILSGLLDKGAAVFDVSVDVGGRSVHSFDGDLTISFTVSNLSKISDPHILHILTDGTKEYYAPDSISGNTITVKGIRNLSTFAVIPGSEVPKEPTNPFTDAYEGDYYYDAVLWAVENGVTNGTSATTFSPDMAVSRAQMVTFLWRAHGSPKAAGTNPFADVSTSDYYYDAVLWAVANGVTNGTSATTFSPDMDVTRAQAVTFQWRAAGSPVVSGSSFGDVATDAYYIDAVTWAVANGITNGTSSNTFSPDVVVSRAQAVTFLYRELA